MTPFNNTSSGVARWFILTTLLVLPWLHGGERYWEQLVAAGGFFIAVIVMLLDKRALVTLPSGTLLILTLFGVWLLHTLIYLIPLPMGVLAWISPATYTWQSQDPSQHFGYLSLYRQATLVELFKFAGLATLFLLISRLFLTSGRIRWFCAGVVTIGTLTTVYSLINFATGGAIDWVPAIPPWDFSWHQGIRGTFSYKNQYAMYMVICILLTTGLLIDNLRRERATLLTPAVGYFALCLGLQVATLLNTSSRGALVSLVAGCGFTAFLFFLGRPKLLQQWLKPKFLATMVVVVTVMIIAFMQSAVYQRFSEQKMEDNGRTLLRGTVIRVIQDYPVFGTGPGTYPFIQHQYKPLELGNTQMSKRAHNDYLETVATQGALGFTLLAIPAGLLLMRLFRRAPTSSLTGLQLGCQAASVAYLVQAAIDVNIGVYILPVHFVIVLSVGWVIGHLLLTDNAGPGPKLSPNGTG